MKKRPVEPYLSDFPGEWQQPIYVRKRRQAPSGFMVGFTIVLGIILTVLFLMIVHMSLAKAHGPAEWIAKGDYKNRAGDLCCGEVDCGYKVYGDIVERTGGYAVDAWFLVVPPQAESFLMHHRGFVPFNEATPSPTGDFWVCKWGTPVERKCFFAPPRGM